MHVSLAYAISLLHLQLWFTFISQLKRKSTKRNIYIGGFFVATCHAYVTLITDSYFPPLWERVQTMHDKPRLPATHVCNSMPNWYRVSLLAHPKKKLIKLTLSMSHSLPIFLSQSFSLFRYDFPGFSTVFRLQFSAARVTCNFPILFAIHFIVYLTHCLAAVARHAVI